MEAFCAYFESERQYHHALAHSVGIMLNEIVTFKFREDEPARSEELGEALRRAVAQVRDLEDSLNPMWGKISDEYHKLGVCFRQHGQL
jgi:hypothetical protein